MALHTDSIEFWGEMVTRSIDRTAELLKTAVTAGKVEGGFMFAKRVESLLKACEDRLKQVKESPTETRNQVLEKAMTESATMIAALQEVITLTTTTLVDTTKEFDAICSEAMQSFKDNVNKLLEYAKNGGRRRGKRKRDGATTSPATTKKKK